MIDEEWKVLEEELAEQLRLADIGEVAGMMAHEFNDVLNTILLHVALLEQSASTRQLLAVAETVERSRVVSRASAVNTTARSVRSSLLVGALIGLLVGLVAALLWEPIATRRHSA